jgi:hypothetical protein
MVSEPMFLLVCNVAKSNCKIKMIGNRNLRLIGLRSANVLSAALAYDFFRFLKGPL